MTIYSEALTVGAQVLLLVLVVLAISKQFHRSDRNEFIDPAPVNEPRLCRASMI